MFEQASLADLPAFLIGHATDEEAGTGCTAVVAPEGAVCGVDVRGGGPATRETDLLRPENMVQKVHAVVLSGGSAFGLEASCGVMDELAERGVGFELAGMRIPIVPGACLFDLPVGRPAHPDKAMGREAARRAFAGADVASGVLAEGNVGAGTGATVGKFALPSQAMKSGLGFSALRAGGLAVAAVVAVNALGCVRTEGGEWVAGVLGADGRVADPVAAFSQVMTEGSAFSGEEPAESQGPCANTTIGCVLTNANLTKAQAAKTASVVHDAFARAIKPVHTQNDGDAVFCMASGDLEADHDAVGVLATEAMQQAIERAALTARAAYGLPAACDVLSRPVR